MCERCSIYFLQQKKRQKTLAKIKQLTEEENSNTQQKGKSKGRSGKRNQTKERKNTPAKKKATKKSAAPTNCNISQYFTVKK